MGKLIGIIIDELMVLFIAALPLVELRGAIPIGVSMGMNPVHATVLGILGSLIPVPFLLFFLEPIFMYLKSTKSFKGFADKTVKRTMKKGKNIGKYRTIGLIIFVAIPLPGTGVWSGSLASVLFNIPKKHAFPAIALGNAIAGIIIFVLSYIVVNV
ncbi:MAG: COG2426 family protein [Candidatus Alkaliphilus sp. MAG34]|mgnify:CR=1 FL=1